jgi:hypothetical protein
MQRPPGIVLSILFLMVSGVAGLMVGFGPWRSTSNQVVLIVLSILAIAAALGILASQPLGRALALLLVVVVVTLYGSALSEGTEAGAEFYWVVAAVLMAGYLLTAS